MTEIVIDAEFQSLLPELDEETYTQLEENLILHGCRDSLVLWNKARHPIQYRRQRVRFTRGSPYALSIG